MGATVVILCLVTTLGAGGDTLAQAQRSMEPELIRNTDLARARNASARFSREPGSHDRQRLIDQRRAVLEHQKLTMRDPQLRQAYLQNLRETNDQERRAAIERPDVKLTQTTKSRDWGLAAGAFTDCAGQVEIPVSECEALVTIYNETDGPSWLDSTGWLETDSPCTWFGITCTAGRVSAFDGSVELCYPEEEGGESCFRTGNGLNGPFPVAFADLTGLVELRLPYNNLSGGIPPELGTLANLEVLDLRVNRLEGPIPAELGGLTDLRRLVLQENYLEGGIPVALTQLSELEVLDLGYNFLLGGAIPPEIGSLGNLRELHLFVTSLEGAVPPELGLLGNLQILDLSDNLLYGTIPPEFGQLASLEVARLDGNSLSGPIPPEFSAGLSALRVLWLSGNEFETTIQPLPGELPNLQVLRIFYNPISSLPSELGNLTNLRILDISGLPLFGLPDLSGLASLQRLFADSLQEIYSPIPDWIGNLTNLEILELAFGTFVGPIPATIGNLSALQELGLEFNLLSGELPPTLGDLVSLRKLQLNSNFLEGPIPATIGDLPVLERIILQDNALSGPIPVELADLEQLTELALWQNRLEGEIPPELGNLTHLEGLDLSQNQLQGEIPPELGNLTSLEYLSLGWNQLTGPIPSSLGDLLGLRSLALAGNRLEGPFPGFVTGLANLDTLWLNDNLLHGPIPPALGDLPQLLRVDLSRNQLDGMIPPELGNAVTLSALLLAGNALTGPIPPELGNLGLYGDFEALDLSGNALSGEIPPELAQPFLNSFGCYYGCRLDLSNNQLSGQIPAELGQIPFDMDELGRAVFGLAGNNLHGQVPLAVAVQGASIEQRLGVEGLLEVLTGEAAGLYAAAGAAFGPPLTETGLSATALLADDGVGVDVNDACEPLVNGDALAGNIAVISRGSCSFVTKVRHAQDVGAVAVLMVNSISGAPFAMIDDGTGADITIPSTMISLENGELIRPTLPAAVTLSGTSVPQSACDFSNNNETLFIPDTPEYASLTGEIPYICNLPLLSKAESVETLVLAVDELVETGSLTVWQGRLMKISLDGAVKQLEAGRDWVAASKLRFFIRLVEKYVRFGLLTEEEAQPLVDTARSITALLDGRPPGHESRHDSDHRGDGVAGGGPMNLRRH